MLAKGEFNRWVLKRTLLPMDWASDLFFLGAIATVLWLVRGTRVENGSWR